MKCKIIIGLLILSLSVVFPVISAEQNVMGQDIDIIFLNLPNGEATLIKLETGDNILINTGAKASIESLVFQLEELTVTEIDRLIVTSTTEEYSGNTEAIIKKFNVRNLLLPDNFNLKEEQLLKKTNIKYWSAIEKLSLSSKMKIINIDENSHGDATFLLEYGKESVLFLNDKNTSIEEKLFKNMHQIDIIKIAAFGSGNSPTPHLLEQLDPYIGIIFHSPTHNINEDLVERLAASWIDVYFLKQTGSVYIRLSKDDYELLS
ncbi:hydrolase [Gracilibacillus xinjiangensis]|uniref:Hydrolase n=1 Tax=Gracilibacillus xinjiangensis TaxID=1193282 RepID=A0ABV8WXP9_9BACI